MLNKAFLFKLKCNESLANEWPLNELMKIHPADTLDSPLGFTERRFEIFCWTRFGPLADTDTQSWFYINEADYTRVESEEPITWRTYLDGEECAYGSNGEPLFDCFLCRVHARRHGGFVRLHHRPVLLSSVGRGTLTRCRMTWMAVPFALFFFVCRRWSLRWWTTSSAIRASKPVSFTWYWKLETSLDGLLASRKLVFSTNLGLILFENKFAVDRLGWLWFFLKANQ